MKQRTTCSSPGGFLLAASLKIWAIQHQCVVIVYPLCCVALDPFGWFPCVGVFVGPVGLVMAHATAAMRSD